MKWCLILLSKDLLLCFAGKVEKCRLLIIRIRSKVKSADYLSRSLPAILTRNRQKITEKNDF